MIIVLGSVMVYEARLSEALEKSREHVARSRTEPGCIAHAVYQDPEIQCRLVFLEEWSDHAALARHFDVPASKAFVKGINELAVEPPSISVFNVEPVSLRNARSPITLGP